MVNQCNFIGNLGADPDARKTQSGISVVTLNLAVSERWKDKEGVRQEKTEWIRCVVWNKLADFCENYLKKGNRIYLSGKFTTRKWQDQAGNDKYTTEIIANEIKNLSPREQNAEENHREPYDQRNNLAEEVPF